MPRDHQEGSAGKHAGWNPNKNSAQERIHVSLPEQIHAGTGIP
jgi:hypothetical protein